MIHRTPIPKGEQFIKIRNSVVRDRRLSFLARGILASVLSRPDNWQVSADRLARETDAAEGVKAIRSALRELEKAGYLIRQRMQDPSTGKWTWRQVFRDTPATSPDSDGSAISPSPTFGDRTFGEGTSKEPPIRTTKEELRAEMSCPDFTRFAPEVGRESDSIGIWPAVADTPEEQDLDEEEGAAERFARWRTEDRELFEEHIGDKLKSWGGAYNTGTFSAPQFYDLFHKGKKIQWPGRYLAHLDEYEGVDDWLANLGLERVD